MRRKLISEVFVEAAKLNTKSAKIAYLQKNNSAPLRDIIRINFDDDIVSLLPKGAPPYKKDDMVDGHNYSTLYHKFRQFKYFFKGPKTNMSQVKRESVFISLLESIHPNDAELFIQAKDKNLKYKGITKKLCQDAFPNLISK
jgi:hypothetical protein